jgi:hypothetical protein
MGFGFGGVANSGAEIYANGGSFADGFGGPICFRGAIYGITASGSSAIAIQEW